MKRGPYKKRPKASPAGHCAHCGGPKPSESTLTVMRLLMKSGAPPESARSAAEGIVGALKIVEEAERRRGK
ncbi:MAG: hypothetical protein U1B94_01405 [candidate division NC10 bacterium]|nr:hypothetical protein [candidate division NC10 bacterium]